MTSDDGSPFFIAPHRFDAAGATDQQPVLDRHHEPVPEPGERVLARHRLTVAGHLLGPAVDRRQWLLTPTATVTVTDRRVVHVCDLALAPVGDGSRLRPPGARPVTGQVRWQWPSRLELRPTAPDGTADLLVVCDALRTIAQPALGLSGPAPEVTALARLVRRAVADFRLANPEVVELSVAERDVLLRRAGTGSVVRGVPVTLPGSLPVEFLSRDDYYHPPLRSRRTPRRSTADRPGSAC